MTMNRRTFSTAIAAASLPYSKAIFAQKKRFPGVSDNEIRIGSTGPISGGAAAFSNINKGAGAYFAMINAAGGVNGRKINFMLLDDSFSPPKTVEQTRKLVEREDVAFMTCQVGTATAVSVRKYLNDAKVPQLFVQAGADLFIDEIDKFPLTCGWMPLYSDEGRAIGRHLLAEKPNAKIAVLYQNDDSGRGYVRGMKDALGSRSAQMIVSEATYEATDPTVDSQLISAQQAGADVMAVFAIGKVASQAIRRVYDNQWRPTLFISQATSSVQQVLQPAGLERAKGAYCANFLKDPNDAAWANDKGIRDFHAMMEKFGPGLPRDTLAMMGTGIASTVVQVLKQCGDELSRENMVRQTMALDMDLPILLPGVRIKTSEKDRHPLRQMRMQQFDGATWKLVASK